MSLVGNLQDLSLPDIFQIISLSRKTGVLRLRRDAQRKGEIVFDLGRIVAAWDTASTEAVVKLLTKEQIVIPNIRARLQKETPGPLVALKELLAPPAVDENRLADVMERFTRSVVMRLVRWDVGSFQFQLEEDPNAPRISDLCLVPQGLGVIDIGLHGAAAIDEEERAEESSEPAFSQTQADELGWETSAAPVTHVPRDTLFDLAEELRDQFETSQHQEREMTSPGLPLLKAMLLELHVPNVHTYITLLVLRYASAVMNRALLLEARPEDLVGLGEFGITPDKETSARLVRQIRIPMKEPSIFAMVADQGCPRKIPIDTSFRWNRYLVEQLGGELPSEVFVGPVFCNQRLVAFLYGDNLPGSEPIGDTDALEIFLSQAGVAMERRLLEGSPF